MHEEASESMSPPSRRRGLKSCVASLISLINRRLLRGGVDWNNLGKNGNEGEQSPPSRRRGLKSYILYHYLRKGNGRLLRGGVDWNIVSRGIFKRNYESPPSRRRGLKFVVKNGYIPIQIVASFAEAWIEIKWSIYGWCTRTPSPPSRRRGLK